LKRADFTAKVVRGMVMEIIGGSRCRAAAGQMAVEIAAQPAPARVVRRLEGLAVA
jgi:UDP:flavonoid glycosyltransferase YjiC (YdhE family)